MNKKVSLKEIVGTKIVYAIILTSYYWMWARTDWKDWYEMMQYVLGVFLFSFFSVQMIRISKYKKEGIDEMAEQNLKRCDSICLKLFVGVMVVVAFGAAIFGHTNVVSTGFIGWTIVLSILVLSIIRTVMFVVMDSKGYNMALITKIKEYRERAGYRQSELAEMVGARRETIVHLENGRYNPSLKLAMDIAKIFNVTVEELFEFVDNEK